MLLKGGGGVLKERELSVTAGIVGQNTKYCPLKGWWRGVLFFLNHFEMYHLSFVHI